MLNRDYLKATAARILSFILFCFILYPAIVKAQVPSTAAAYPFVPSQKTFTYLTGGTVVSFTGGNDDGYAQNIPLGFTFPFCTGTYTAIHACTNGWISFNPTSTTNSLTNSNTTTSDPALFPLWDDVSVNPGGNVSYLTTGAAPNRIFTIEYKGAQWYYNNNSPYPNVISFQVKLYEAGVIEFLYQQEVDPVNTVNSTPSASIGIKGPGTSDYQTLNGTGPTPGITVNPTFYASINTRPATGQSYLWGQIPCTGVPTTSVTGPPQVCPGKSFTVSLSGLSLFSGLTYQWQSSPDGATWANITGATNSSYTDIIYTPKWYRCIVTCTNSSQVYTTAGYYMKIAPFYYCYCDQTSNSQTGIDIGNVTVHTTPSNDTVLDNGIVTSLENNTSANKGYTDLRYIVPEMPMYHDTTYRFTVKQINSGTFTNGMATIFIDYNRNGTFDDTERILLQSTVNVLPDPGVVSGTFKLPAAAKYGFTGMRVIIGSGNSAPDSCANTANGETEDYLVDLRYVPCSGKPDSARIEGDTSMCIGYDYVLTDTVYEKYRHGIERYWQLSADGVNWLDIAGSKNKDTITRTFGGQPFYYRVQTVCTHTHDTTSGHPHKVNIKPTYKCYCHSQSYGGYEDSSDIGAFTLHTLNVSDGGTHLLNPNAYRKRQDRTDLTPIEIDVDSIYHFSVFHTMPYHTHADGKITVFVDFNNNKKYDIPEERIFTGFTSIGYHVLLNALLIPDNVIVNVPTGLRVIINNDVAPNIPSDEACGEYFSGETEDYIVVFKRPFPAGIREATSINQLSLVPNPTSGKFQLQFKGAAGNIAVRILNITGQVVKQQVYQHTGGIFRQTIDLGNEAKGMYMVEITANGQKMVERLTVQ